MQATMDTEIEMKTGKRDQQVYSPCSSPSHEFSFTISFDPSSNNNIDDKKSIPPPPPLFSSALDLSPADDIFFHGHLLPLHLLPHLPNPTSLSPRNSLDSFTLPIQDPPQDHTSYNNNSISNSNSNSISNQCNANDVLDGEDDEVGIPIRPKAKSFSIFGKSRWRKESENGEKERQKKKARFDVSHMLKRYMRMVKPLLSSMNKSNNKRGNGDQLLNHKKQPHSYSGNVSLRYEDNDDSSFETRRREFSAPASMWTSPSNSGILVQKGKNSNSNLRTPSSSSGSSDSTMEELQAAIQAAITHCKNSIATN